MLWLFFHIRKSAASFKSTLSVLTAISNPWNFLILLYEAEFVQCSVTIKISFLYMNVNTLHEKNGGDMVCRKEDLRQVLNSVP